MIILRVFPVIFSFLLLAAHFSRANLLPLAILALLIPLLLFVKRSWSARTIQVLLFFGAFEWVRIMFYYIEIRKSIGDDWTRLAIILSFVALITLASGLIFQTKKLRQVYGLVIRKD